VKENSVIILKLFQCFISYVTTVLYRYATAEWGRYWVTDASRQCWSQTTGDRPSTGTADEIVSDLLMLQFYGVCICEGGLGSGNSVRLSVCHTRGLLQN